MKRREANAIIKKLSQRFSLKLKSGKDHDKYNVYNQNKLITLVRFSHTLKDYHDNLIASNLFLSTTQLYDYIDCSFSNQNLIETLKNKGRWKE